MIADSDHPTTPKTIQMHVPLAGAWLLLAVLACAIAWVVNPAPAGEPGAQPSTAAPRESQDPAGKPSQPRRKYTTETLRGRVVWLEDALARGFDVTTEPDAAETTVVLETAERRLWPIVPDTRGRAFAVDERLRGVKLQLLVRRYADAPLVQIIRVFRPKADGIVYEVDYWCDICSIPMYILKPCECCQGPTRLRERAVEQRSQGG